MESTSDVESTKEAAEYRVTASIKWANVMLLRNKWYTQTS